MNTTDDETIDMLRLAWETGRDYQQARHDEAVDDLDHAAPLARTPTRTYEERIADRHTEMAPFIVRPREIPAWLAVIAERQRRHDAAVLSAGLQAEPITTWEEAHANSEPHVWIRIWGNLSPATQAQIAQLDLSQPQLGHTDGRDQ